MLVLLVLLACGGRGEAPSTSEGLARPGGHAERCNGLDDDGDGRLARGETDADGDGQLDCAPCDVAGFWKPTRELEGKALSRALVQMVEPQWCRSYGDATRSMFLELDRDPVTGEIECVYTGRRIRVDGAKPDPKQFNTEHSWPQSRGAGRVPARCDLHHLFPTDAGANRARGNLPFGEVTLAVDWERGGSRRGRDAQGRRVFEPRDAHKGNVARAMLYFSHRYGHVLTPEELELYRSWHAADPVDERELARTMAILGEQVVANPFVVCPFLVDEL